MNRMNAQEIALQNEQLEHPLQNASSEQDAIIQRVHLTSSSDAIKLEG